MADKTSVKVNKVAVKSIFDDKHKARATAVMQKAAESAVKGSSALTLDAPKDKAAKSWSLDISLVSLAPDKAGKKLEGKCSMAISSSSGGIKSIASGSAATAIKDAKNVDPGDAEAVADGCAKAALKSAVDYMAKNKP